MNVSNPIELINITPFNPLISKCQIKVCWVGYQPNRNRSVITKQVATEMANSLPGSPIVGFYNEETGDFEQHNKAIEIKDGKISLKPTTKPYGFVDLNAKVWFQWFLDEDGITREYLVTEGWLWTGQYPEAQRVIDKGNNHSMELSDDPRFLDAYWTKDQNGNKEFFIINEAIFSKLCILGEEYEPCFEGSTIGASKIEFSFEDDFKQQMFSMMEEIKNILNEGGAKMVDEENKVVDQEEETAGAGAEPEITEPAATEEPESTDFEKKDEEEKGEDKEEVCPECGKPLSECTCGDKDDEDKKKDYNLDEIPEYVAAINSLNELTTQFNELKASAEAAAAELETLKAYRADIEKKEKEKMINSFYMLSDEDKKDVVDNIDSYSLDDIEAKLSIICVRNKVSFDLDKDKEDEEDPITFNLNGSGNSSNNDVPEWLQAVQNFVAEN